MIPPGGQTSYGDIAEQTGLSEQIVLRLLRHAMTMRVFREPEPGMVAHTKVSKTLANPVMNDWLRIGTEEMWPAATKVCNRFHMLYRNCSWVLMGTRLIIFAVYRWWMLCRNGQDLASRTKRYIFLPLRPVAVDTYIVKRSGCLKVC
jgi:hypothetical protein